MKIRLLSLENRETNIFRATVSSVKEYFPFLHRFRKMFQSCFCDVLIHLLNLKHRFFYEFHYLSLKAFNFQITRFMGKKSKLTVLSLSLTFTLELS